MKADELGRDLYSFKQLSLTHSQLRGTFQPHIFRTIRIPIFAVDPYPALIALKFFSSRLDICVQVRKLILPIDVEACGVFPTNIALLETLLKQLSELRKIQYEIESNEVLF